MSSTWSYLGLQWSDIDTECGSCAGDWLLPGLELSGSIVNNHNITVTAMDTFYQFPGHQQLQLTSSVCWSVIRSISASCSLTPTISVCICLTVLISLWSCCCEMEGFPGSQLLNCTSFCHSNSWYCSWRWPWHRCSSSHCYWSWTGRLTPPALQRCF